MDHLMNTIKRDITLLKGKGCYVHDSAGNKYIDMVGGLGAISIGHCNKEVSRAMARQSRKLVHCTNIFYNEPQLKLAEKLCLLSGLEKCFLSNSGTEAVETAIKLARKNTRKHKIISMVNAFHGRTLGSLSATWKERYRQDFAPLIEGFEFAEYGRISDLEKKICAETAAVILEPVQGEAGVIIPPQGYLKSVRELCDKSKVLMVLDEVQTGNGRTGTYFCYEQEGIFPDIVVTAKGLANGLPIGATLSKKGIDFEPGDHNSTFGGNPLCSAAALKTISIIEHVLEDVEKKGSYFKQQLQGLGHVREIRQKGLMIGLSLDIAAKQYATECKNQGLLVNIIDEETIRLLPPLTIIYKEIDKIANIMYNVSTRLK